MAAAVVGGRRQDRKVGAPGLVSRRRAVANAGASQETLLERGSSRLKRAKARV